MISIFFWRFLTIFSVGLFLVPACSGASPTTSNPSAVAAAENVAQAFITAEETKSASDYLELFSNDALFMDNSNATMRERGPDLMRLSQTYVKYLFDQTKFAIKFNAHFISQDGRFITLTGAYTNAGKDGNLASVPICVVLEVKGGKIVRQDDYYDSGPYY